MPFKELLRARFATALNAVPNGTWKVLITDSYSQRLLDGAYTNYEILQQNVTSVEPLHSPRRPEDRDAVYLLTPTAQHVERVIADFADGRRTYRSAHVFFIDGIDDQLADRLTAALQPLGVLKAFVELYCNFEAVEDRVFSIKTPSAFFSMFGTAAGGDVASDFAMEAFHDDMAVAGRTILSVLATLNENPYIRYYQPLHHAPLGPLAPQTSSMSIAPSSRIKTREEPKQNGLHWRSALGGSSRNLAEPQGDYLSKQLAVRVQNDLDEYMANNPDFPTPSDRPRATLFIVDRSMDPAAAILHEFWYQAMVNDLLPIQDGKSYKYKYENTVGGKETREAIIDDEDKVWTSVRHLHMKDAIDQLLADFRRFAQEHAGFNGASNVQISDLKDMLASLPQFQKERDLYSLHLDMAQECMNIFQKNRLHKAAEVEQSCATGYTAEGKSASAKTIVADMVPLLDDASIDRLDKVRIIALYIMHRDGVADEDRRRLYQHARLSISEQDMVNNFVHLGVTIVTDSNKPRFRGSRIKQKNARVEEGFELSRYKPVVQMMLEDASANRLDQNQFPFVRDMPAELSQSLRAAQVSPAPSSATSLRSQRPTWHKAPSARNNDEGRQKYIVFVAGGVTYAEIRQAYVLGKMIGKDIYLGSTHIITPGSFLKDIKSLGRGGIGSNPPCGFPIHPQNPLQRPANRDPGGKMPYQLVLDQRHWEPPVGPPALAAPRPGQPSHLSGTERAMSNLSISSKDSKGSSSKPDKEKKRSVFKMKWGKD